jgi:predicted RNase H-like HicB family nuclease
VLIWNYDPTMAHEHIVQAEWDAEAGVWVATSDDVPGLVTEAKTFEALLKKLRVMVPEMLELNGAMPKSGKTSYRVVAQRSESAFAAE